LPAVAIRLKSEFLLRTRSGSARYCDVIDRAALPINIAMTTFVHHSNYHSENFDIAQRCKRFRFLFESFSERRSDYWYSFICVRGRFHNQNWLFISYLALRPGL